MQYQRHIDPGGDDSLALLLRRIPRGAGVLELGPATGYCSRYLRDVMGCAVDAVELSATMAEQARPFCRRLLVGDVEDLDLTEALGGERYDVILCADVIEHLRDPWSLATKLAEQLKADGRLLMSVPNVGYLGLVVDLIRGNFRYRNEGLLDRTHLRFFTLATLREMLEQSGWHLWSAEQVALSLTDSEFRVRLEALSPALRDELLARPDALCYQWVVEARRTPPLQPPALPQAVAADRFQVRVFWHDRDNGFDDSRNCLAWAVVGRERQTVVLDLPAGQQALALLVSNRTGFMRLHHLRLLTERGNAVWEWTPASGDLPVAGRTQVEPTGDRGLWFVSGTESRLQLELPELAVAAANRIELTLDSPMSADFIAAQAYWSDPQGLPAQLAVCRESCARLGAVRAVVGDDDSAWPAYARIIRVASRIPGLVSFVDALARLRGKIRRR